jgi:hypothetical protein
MGLWVCFKCRLPSDAGHITLDIVGDFSITTMTIVKIRTHDWPLFSLLKSWVTQNFITIKTSDWPLRNSYSSLLLAAPCVSKVCKYKWHVASELLTRLKA